MSVFKKIKKRWYFILIVLITFLAPFFYQKQAFSAKAKKENEYIVKRQTLKEELSLSGKIDAEEQATLRFQSSGRLTWVGVKEGDYVKKYQGIASLDQRDLKNRLTKYLNTYVKSRLDFDQTKDDYWNKQYDLSETIRKSAQRILEKNQYDLNNAVLDVEYQDLSVEYANLSTPIEGIVVRVNSPYAGVNITPSQAEFEIVNPKTVYFSASADQTEVVKLKEKMKGRIVLDSYEDKELGGEIEKISFVPKTGETGTVYEIKIYFNEDNSDYKYRLGMTGDVSFILKEKKNAIAVPSSYIKSDRKGKFVYKKVNDKKEKFYIKTGEEIDDKVEVIEGIKDGDLIL